MNPIIIIPARLAATRLPRKPLLDIHGKPMILHVCDRALEADIGKIVVAAGDKEIFDVVQDAGMQAVLTNPELASGSDRIYEALKVTDPDEKHDIVVNLQGDLPTVDPVLLAAILPPLKRPEVDISTLAAIIRDEDEKNNPNVVKVVMSPDNHYENIGRALYFTRATAPWGDGNLLHHIGIYAYQRAALKRFIHLKPSYLEKREKLEQLRALEYHMRIDVTVVDTVPLGVDVASDLEKARAILENYL
ncbi:MAG: 3-deoxy-manno-octulosonate cytidylyltransferase (CMP-KDO synthetase) [Alphaproteobacteria bacterium]|jgi:3-deoxy-manno-octulosonate cytidylyltransferase (CMP-KDO synthetase)